VEGARGELKLELHHIIKNTIERERAKKRQKERERERELARTRATSNM